MVFHGILKKYFFNSEDQTEYLAFLQGLTDRASLKPLEQLSQVGKTIAQAMAKENVRSIEELRSTPSWLQVTKAADDYVTAFGSRTPGELKLESVRLTDDISHVLDMALKAHESTFAVYAEAHSTNDEQAPQLAWPKHVKRYQRPLLRYVANNTRKAIDWRERFRFNRAQTFDLSRSMYDAVGKVLTAENLIAESRDIYWLTESEIDEIVNGHAWSLDAKALISSRKELFDSYSQNKMSLAVKGAGVIAPASLSPVLPTDSQGGLAGKGVAPGILTAEVIICTEFDPSVDVRGKILVVHHIDPGWTLLFTQAAGIVAERGNALSHAAIIAREIGIPAVVAAPDVTSTLHSGEIITINGITGSIVRESN
jgi:pyruvate,water dikinase